MDCREAKIRPDGQELDLRATRGRAVNGPRKSVYIRDAGGYVTWLSYLSPQYPNSLPRG